MGKTVKKLAIGTLLAAAAGYVAGILTAPKSGKETRKDLKDTALQKKVEIEKQLKRLHTEMNAMLEQAKVQTDDLKGKARDEVNDAAGMVKEVKERIRELLSAFHEGDADDKDLHKAVADANDALEHLKKYLKKYS